MTRPRAAWTPALRDGVAASRVAVSAGPWTLLADFLAARLPGATDWPRRLARGQVLDAHGQPLPPDAPCVPGAVLWYWRAPPPEHTPPEDITVLHQDAHIVAVDKPHFMSVTPGGRHLHQTVLVRLKRLLGITTLVPMHRLDRETAGVLLFVVQPQHRHAYQTLLRERQVHKVYEAVAPWREGLQLPYLCTNRLVEPSGADFMQMQVLPGEPNARTHIALLRRLGPLPAGWPVEPVEPVELLELAEAVQAVDRHSRAAAPSGMALYRLLPETGRKHQLRMHMLALHLPILGDRIYPRLLPEPALDAAPDWQHPLQLLAREIAFADPITGKMRRFVSQRRLQLAG